MNDCMADIETPATGKNAAILAVGSVMFDPKSGTTGAEFYRNIELKSCTDVGLEMDASTFYFWIGEKGKTNQQARDALLEDRVTLTEFCQEWFDWVKGNGAKSLWGNGITFDNELLRNAYRAAGEKFPFHWTADMDVRTLVSLYRRAGHTLNKSKDREGVYHHALDDAKHQAKYVGTILRALNMA